jgi:hypothetical protein
MRPPPVLRDESRTQGVQHEFRSEVSGHRSSEVNLVEAPEAGLDSFLLGYLLFPQAPFIQVGEEPASLNLGSPSAAREVYPGERLRVHAGRYRSRCHPLPDLPHPLRDRHSEV